MRAEPAYTPSVAVCERIFARSNLNPGRTVMGLGKGALLWLIGIPIPIILLLMFFLR